jgi:hypothetical protein
MFWGKQGHLGDNPATLLDFWGPYGPAKEQLCKKMSNLGKGYATIYQC